MCLVLMCLGDVSNANQAPGNEGEKAVTEVPDVAERFESHFPNTCGEWESEEDISHEPQYKRDRVRNVVRLFRNKVLPAFQWQGSCGLRSSFPQKNRMRVL
jgi:hypothetical protein